MRRCALTAGGHRRCATRRRSEPRLPRVAVERERPVLGEGGGARLAAGQDRRGVAILDVAPAVRARPRSSSSAAGRRRRARRSGSARPSGRARPAGSVRLGSPGCSRSRTAWPWAIERSRASSPSTASAQAVAARRAVTSSTSGAKRPSARLRSSAAARASPCEVEVGDLGDLHVLGHRVGDGALDQRLVAHALLVRQRRLATMSSFERVRALGALLDRGQDPAARGVCARASRTRAGGRSR